MKRNHFISGTLCIFACGPLYASHTPLLPRPQQVHYGSGSIPLAGMRIAFSSSPSVEDRFGAQRSYQAF